jgi:hypothetical protein
MSVSVAGSGVRVSCAQPIVPRVEPSDQTTRSPSMRSALVARAGGDRKRLAGGQVVAVDVAVARPASDGGRQKTLAIHPAPWTMCENGQTAVDD